ncbi:glycosyltransferase family 2 protein [Kitasatospora sp. NPDC006697]|uniref:glycosyltransferase family 2 protein n=1 Tax=Kitasatospora sp. NPDC006697 TaxID=3364020 RepID=UPI0036AC5493
MPQPLLSVVVPAYDQQGQLSACLDSVLGQSFGGFEVIVVADRSPECPAGVAQAEGDERVSLLRLNAAVGVGRARNAGAARASGRYLLFLDADHLVSPGAFLSLADRVREVPDADLLLFGHTRLHRGRVWPGAAEAALDRLGEEVFAPTERSELFGVPAQAWDRLISRELWIGERLAFPDGQYEEVSTVHHALLRARRAAVLPRELVQLRRRQTVHPAGSPGSTVFDLFDQYEQSFELLEGLSLATAQEVRPHLFRRMVRHYLFVLDLAGCVSRTERPQFFHRAAEHYRRLQPAGFQRPAGREGVKFSLLAGGSYSAFEVAKLTQIARTAVAGRTGL